MGGSEIQERAAIGNSTLLIQISNDCFIAGQLAIIVERSPNEIRNRVKPVDALYDHGKPFIQNVVSAPVRKLMTKYIIQLLL